MAQRDLNAGNRFTAALISGAFPAGIIGYANRTTTKATAGASVEVGYLRLDSIALKAGRAYLVMAQNLRLTDATVGTADHWVVELRYDGTGAAATTSSTEIGKSEGTTSTDSVPPAIGWVMPSADATGSFLLSLRRSSGGTDAITIQADTGGVNITVWDMGLAVADTGTDI